MKLSLQVHRKGANGLPTSRVHNFEKDYVTIGDRDTDLPLSDALGTVMHLVFHQGMHGELRVLGAKSSFSFSVDAIMTDDHKVKAGQTLNLGGVTLQILAYQPDHHPKNPIEFRPAERTPVPEPELPAGKNTTFAPFTLLATQRRIVPR